MNKVYSLHDAVAKFVESGDCISFGGFTTNRKPYAAVSEILRQGQKDFTVWAGPAGGDWDMLIGEGRVKAYINCYTANSGYTNVSRRFRAAIEKGELIYEDYSQDVLMLQLHAASLGLPFLPVRLMQGSGLVKYWGISEEQRKTLDKVDDLKCVEVENPFNPGEMCIRDSYWALAIFVLASLTDTLDGYIARHYNQITDFGKFMDPLADKCLVTAAMLWFVEIGQMPGWALLVVIIREFGVSGLRMVAADKGRVIAAGWCASS